jgi:hypothetical protein
MASSAPDAPGPEVLLPVLACAVGVSLWAVVEVARNRRLLLDEPDLARSSAGWEMRLLFHRLLALSNGLRALALVLELALGARAMDSECAHVECWALGLAHGLADLSFLCTFSLLTLFWAQLHYATWGVSYASLRPGFLLANNVVGVIFVILAVASAANRDYRLLRVGSAYVLAISYLVAAALMVFYGAKVVAQLRPQPASLQQFPARSMILRRVVALCLMCSLALTAHAVFCVAQVAIWGGDLGYPGFTSKYGVDALRFSLLDLVPSLLIMLLTVKKNVAAQDGGAGLAPPQPGSQLQSHGSRGDLLYESSGDLYAPFSVTPTMLEDSESLAQRLLRSDNELESQARQPL